MEEPTVSATATRPPSVQAPTGRSRPTPRAQRRPQRPRSRQNATQSCERKDPGALALGSSSDRPDKPQIRGYAELNGVRYGPRPWCAQGPHPKRHPASFLCGSQAAKRGRGREGVEYSPIGGLRAPRAPGLTRLPAKQATPWAPWKTGENLPADRGTRPDQPPHEAV